VTALLYIYECIEFFKIVIIAPMMAKFWINCHS
jgi:hypothetical protein